jgi:uncharacterized membrane protein YdjX (TVP38/TMEM64 family)
MGPVWQSRSMLATRALSVWPAVPIAQQWEPVRLFRIILALSLLVLIPFLLWGDQLLTLFDATAARMRIQNYGPWGWLAVIGLLVVDLFLPIPATGVMSAAGYVYGAWVGGIISLVGSLLSGLLAYVLCRWFGRRAAEWLAGAEGLAENERLFERSGPWLILLSRWLPMLPEIIACLAGLARMRFNVFLVALICGTVPPAFTYAAVGALFDSEPAWAIAFSILLPVILWLAFRPFLRARQAPPPTDS